MSRLPEIGDTLATLPLRTVEAGAQFYRVSDIAHPSCIYYSRSPESRWTPKGGAIGVCYLAQTQVGALAETVCRNSVYLRDDERVSSLYDLHQRGMYRLGVVAAINVLDLTVSNLVKYRLDAEIMADYDKTASPPYRFCPTWAAHAVDLGLGGILFRSRHCVDQVCLALFQDRTALLELPQGHLDEARYLRLLDDEFNWGIVP